MKHLHMLPNFIFFLAGVGGLLELSSLFIWDKVSHQLN